MLLDAILRHDMLSVELHERPWRLSWGKGENFRECSKKQCRITKQLPWQALSKALLQCVSSSHGAEASRAAAAQAAAICRRAPADTSVYVFLSQVYSDDE